MEPKIVETQPYGLESANQKPDRPHLADESLFWLSLCFPALWAVAVLLFQLSKINWQNRSLQRSKKIPCHTCQYFSNSSHLKCAVHPTLVLSKDAIDCSDYQKDENPKLLGSSKW